MISRSVKATVRLFHKNKPSGDPISREKVDAVCDPQRDPESAPIRARRSPRMLSGVSMATYKVYRNLSVLLFSVLILAISIVTFLAVKACVEVQMVNQELQNLKWEVNEMRAFHTQMQLDLEQMSIQEIENAARFFNENQIIYPGRQYAEINPTDPEPGKPAASPSHPVPFQPCDLNETNDGNIEDSQNYIALDDFNSDTAYEGDPNFGDIGEGDGYDDDFEDSYVQSYEESYGENYEDYLDDSDLNEDDSELPDVVTVNPDVSSNEANNDQDVYPTFKAIFDTKSNTFKPVKDDCSPPECSDSPRVGEYTGPIFALPQQDTSTGNDDIMAQYQNNGEYDPNAVENELLMGDGYTNDWKPSVVRAKRNVISHRGISINLENLNDEETETDNKAADAWKNSDRDTTVTDEGGVQRRLRHKQKNVESLDEKPPRLGRMKPLVTTHYGGDTSKYVVGTHDNFNGNGHLRHPQRTFVDWMESDWVSALGMDRHFTMTDGTVTLKDSGLYFVYAQIYYLDEHDTNGFRVYKNGEPILQCTTTSHSNHRIMKGNTCFTAAAQFLQQGDRISIGDLSDSRYSLFEPEKSFFGLVKLGDRKMK